MNALDLLVRVDKHRTLLLCTLFIESAGKFSIYRGDKLAWTCSGMTGIRINLATLGPSLAGATDFRVEVDESLPSL